MLNYRQIPENAYLKSRFRLIDLGSSEPSRIFLLVFCSHLVLPATRFFENSSLILPNQFGGFYHNHHLNWLRCNYLDHPWPTCTNVERCKAKLLQFRWFGLLLIGVRVGYSTNDYWTSSIFLWFCGLSCLTIRKMLHVCSKPPSFIDKLVNALETSLYCMNNSKSLWHEFLTNKN